MCGRFSFSANEKIIEEHYGFVPDEKYSQNYNCAPSQQLPVITNQKPDAFSYFLWGFIPHWAKNKSVGAKMINARSETLAEKPAYKSAFKNFRCLVPADSFYEWSKDNDKNPYRIFLKSKPLFSMAGIWSLWKNETEEIYSFAIVTTFANEKMNSIHDRMPVILQNKDQENIWLFEKDTQKISTLFSPVASDLIEMYPVSKQLNFVKNNSESLHKKCDYPALFS